MAAKHWKHKLTRKTFVPQKLAEARLACGMSQIQAHIRLHELGVVKRVQKEIVHQWERGDRVPRSEVIANLAVIYGVPVEYFFASEPVITPAKAA